MESNIIADNLLFENYYIMSNQELAVHLAASILLSGEDIALEKLVPTSTMHYIDDHGSR